MKEFKSWSDIEVLDAEIEKLNKIKKETEENIKYLEQIKKRLEEEKQKFNEPWKPDYSEICYIVGEYDRPIRIRRGLFKEITELPTSCFKTREEAEQRAKEIKVYNLLKDFSMANDGDKIDETHRAFIFKDKNGFKVHSPIEDEFNTFCFMVIYFISKEVAEEALRRYKKELEELVK